MLELEIRLVDGGELILDKSFLQCKEKNIGEESNTSLNIRYLYILD